MTVEQLINTLNLMVESNKEILNVDVVVNEMLSEWADLEKGDIHIEFDSNGTPITLEIF